jgi:hypothetical protein
MLIDLARCEDLFHTPLCRHRDRRTPRNLAHPQQTVSDYSNNVSDSPAIFVFIATADAVRPAKIASRSIVAYLQPTQRSPRLQLFFGGLSELEDQHLRATLPALPWNHTTNRTWEVLTNKGGGWFSRMWRSQLRSLVRAGRPAAPAKMERGALLPLEGQSSPALSRDYRPVLLASRAAVFSIRQLARR